MTTGGRAAEADATEILQNPRARPDASAKSMPAHAMVASWKSMPSTTPIYNIEGLGIKFVASPRHADMLLVTGPVTHNMEAALQRTYDATPDPKLVVAVGRLRLHGGIFGENYASCGRVANVLPVDVAVPGCPPPPVEILRGILTAVQTNKLTNAGVPRTS